MTEEATIRARQSIRRALIQAGGLLVGSLLLTVAHKVLGWIDQETTTRCLMVLFGIFLMAMGNSMPKQHDGPAPETPEIVAVRQSILRVGGWAMVLGGLIWAVLWVFAPRDFAEIGSVVALAFAMLVMVAYSVWRYQAYRRSIAR